MVTCLVVCVHIFFLSLWDRCRLFADLLSSMPLARGSANGLGTHQNVLRHLSASSLFVPGPCYPSGGGVVRATAAPQQRAPSIQYANLRLTMPSPCSPSGSRIALAVQASSAAARPHTLAAVGKPAASSLRISLQHTYGRYPGGARSLAPRRCITHVSPLTASPQPRRHDHGLSSPRFFSINPPRL
ncbi:hypothetical protein DFH06DRAFT_375200 [Mycena polygramma]|nr:hypothetical protein DFH06DRAFT_375200 [Mycena polygramma]